MRTIDIDTLYLAKGGHEKPNAGLCMLEAAAYLAGEEHTDQPQCVSPILGAFGRNINDRLDDVKRQQLKPLIPSLLGTADDGFDGTRGYLALDWLVRIYTPAWLDIAGLTEDAAELRGLRRIVDLAAAQAAGPVVRASADKAAAAWDAAGGAAMDAARDAAWDAAMDAAGGAAMDAAWDAAWDAAMDALKPTVDQLQDSAIVLFAEMISPR